MNIFRNAAVLKKYQVMHRVGQFSVQARGEILAHSMAEALTLAKMYHEGYWFLQKTGTVEVEVLKEKIEPRLTWIN